MNLVFFIKIEVEFSFIPNNIKNDVRYLEKMIKSVEKIQSHINEQCLINKLLPNYTYIYICVRNKY